MGLQIGTSYHVCVVIDDDADHRATDHINILYLYVESRRFCTPVFLVQSRVSDMGQLL